jgi:hypothetical protein
MSAPSIPKPVKPCPCFTPAVIAGRHRWPSSLAVIAGRHRWEDHFELRGYRIELLTPIGAATVRLLRLNADQRIAERRILDP